MKNAMCSILLYAMSVLLCLAGSNIYVSTILSASTIFQYEPLLVTVVVSNGTENAISEKAIDAFQLSIQKDGDIYWKDVTYYEYMPPPTGFIDFSIQPHEMFSSSRVVSADYRGSCYFSSIGRYRLYAKTPFGDSSPISVEVLAPPNENKKECETIANEKLYLMFTEYAVQRLTMDNPDRIQHHKNRLADKNSKAMNSVYGAWLVIAQYWLDKRQERHDAFLSGDKEQRKHRKELLLAVLKNKNAPASSQAVCISEIDMCEELTLAPDEETFKEQVESSLQGNDACRLFLHSKRKKR